MKTEKLGKEIGKDLKEKTETAVKQFMAKKIMEINMLNYKMDRLREVIDKKEKEYADLSQKDILDIYFEFCDELKTNCTATMMVTEGEWH